MGTIPVIFDRTVSVHTAAGLTAFVAKLLFALHTTRIIAAASSVKSDIPVLLTYLFFNIFFNLFVLYCDIPLIIPLRIIIFNIRNTAYINIGLSYFTPIVCCIAQ